MSIADDTDPWRLDLDLMEVEWFTFGKDGTQNKARFSNLQKEREERWHAWERSRVLEEKRRS